MKQLPEPIGVSVRFENYEAGRMRFTLEPAPAVLIMGSLYLAGEVLAANGQVPD